MVWSTPAMSWTWGGARRSGRRSRGAEAELTAEEHVAPPRREVRHFLVGAVEQVLHPPDDGKARRRARRAHQIDSSGEIHARVRRLRVAPERPGVDVRPPPLVPQR